jgi:hypothetical protein
VVKSIPFLIPLLFKYGVVFLAYFVTPHSPSPFLILGKSENKSFKISN